MAQQRKTSTASRAGLAGCALLTALNVAAQAPSPATAASRAPSKPPLAQAWIDVATFSGMGMPMAGAGGSPMAMLGSLFGGGDAATNSFGNTRSMSAGRRVDVTLASRDNPALADAEQAVPAGFMPSALKLRSPREGRRTVDDDTVVEHDVERPRGRLLLYWGCGDTVRAGQPKVLDMVSAMASANSADIAKFFVSRRATQRGAHSATGRPVWPSGADPRMLSAGAQLAGEHGFSGNGVPAGFRFRIPAGQELMPALDLKTREAAGAVELSWAAAPTARAYFASGMAGGTRDEVVLWTSSELPDTGFGLADYQTNSAVDRWLREKVLLTPTTTRCTVPQGVFKGEGAMLRLVAYGNELNLVHPPRPADPKAAWEPEWAVKVRVKSVASTVLGMPDMGGMDKSAAGESTSAPTTPPATENRKPGALDILRNVLGR